MPMETKTALDRLAELRDGVEAAQQRLTEVEEERRASQQSVQRAEEALAGYYRDVELGNAEVDAAACASSARR